jgi:hypothetical protein
MRAANPSESELAVTFGVGAVLMAAPIVCLKFQGLAYFDQMR